jgi:hypothetical protein
LLCEWILGRAVKPFGSQRRRSGSLVCDGKRQDKWR